MPYVYLLFAVVLNALNSVLGKAYNLKNKDCKAAPPIYNLFQSISAFVGWLILFCIDGSFHVKVLPYSLLFALFFTMGLVGMINALKTGPVALTSLMISLSLILVTIWGFIFWNAPVTPIVLVGLVLVVLSIVLCLYTKKSGEKGDEKKISLKWLVYVLIAFVGNAGCTIAQRAQQIAFDGEYGEMLMAFATLLSVIACLTMFLCSDKTGAKQALKGSWYFPTAAGVGTAIFNLLVILMATSTLSPSLIYPVIGVGSLAISTLASLLFKERLNAQQIVGIVLGGVATALLSI